MVSARMCLPRQILVWCHGVSLVSAVVVGPRLFGRSWLSSHMAFSRVACVVASHLDLACLVLARRILRGLILCCLVWIFLFSVLFVFGCCRILLRFAFLCGCLFFCVLPCFVVLSRLVLSYAWGSVFICVCRLTWRMLPLISSGLPCRFAVGIGSFCPRYLFETLLYESPRRKPG